MGISYRVDLGVGFIVKQDALLKPFRKVTEEVFHMEDRFDSKTGAKLEPVKVVDEDTEEYYVLDGEKYDDPYELLQALGEKFNCAVEDQGGYSDGETVYIAVIHDTDEDDGLNDGKLDVGGSALFSDVVAQKEELDRIAKAFAQLDIDLGKPKVFCAWMIS